MRIQTLGSYLCECWTGFAENKTSACEDIDECAPDFFTDIANHNCHKLENRPDIVTGTDSQIRVIILT